MSDKLAEALREVIEDFIAFSPTVFSGRAHDPQDDVDDMMPLSEFECWQVDARAALAAYDAIAADTPTKEADHE